MALKAVGSNPIIHPKSTVVAVLFIFENNPSDQASEGLFHLSLFCLYTSNARIAAEDCAEREALKSRP